MTDWNSPDVRANNAVSLDRAVHAFFGLYIWEWFTSLDADWKYVSNLRLWARPELMFRFLNRYCLLSAMIGLMLILNITRFLAFCTNAIFRWIDLNGVMAMIVTIPSIIVVSIASGRIILLWQHPTRAPTVLPETTEHKPTPPPASPHRHRTTGTFSFRKWHLRVADADFQRLRSAPPSRTGSYYWDGPLADEVRSAGSTRPSSIAVPSLIAPSETYDPHRASQDPSTHLDSASESSARGDRYDLDAQLGATRRGSL
ncbi:hypothetical protein EYR38_003574 [Pleurotus pulmonarius]|nr:hypothetical protein EYR38_003574 [Pleurotus pulmonarius]